MLQSSNCGRAVATLAPPCFSGNRSILRNAIVVVGSPPSFVLGSVGRLLCVFVTFPPCFVRRLREGRDERTTKLIEREGPVAVRPSAFRTSVRWVHCCLGQVRSLAVNASLSLCLPWPTDRRVRFARLDLSCTHPTLFQVPPHGGLKVDMKFPMSPAEFPPEMKPFNKPICLFSEGRQSRKARAVVCVLPSDMNRRRVRSPDFPASKRARARQTWFRSVGRRRMGQVEEAV